MASLDCHMEISQVYQNLNKLGLWAEVNSGYLQLFEELAFTAKSFIDFTARKNDKRAEKQAEN